MCDRNHSAAGREQTERLASRTTRLKLVFTYSKGGTDDELECGLQGERGGQCQSDSLNILFPWVPSSVEPQMAPPL